MFLTLSLLSAKFLPLLFPNADRIPEIPRLGNVHYYSRFANFYRKRAVFASYVNSIHFSMYELPWLCVSFVLSFSCLLSCGTHTDMSAPHACSFISAFCILLLLSLYFILFGGCKSTITQVGLFCNQTL